MSEHLEHPNQESYEIPLPKHIEQMLQDSTCDYPNLILKHSPENFHTIKAYIPIPDESGPQPESPLIHPAIDELVKIILQSYQKIPILLFETQPSSQEEAYDLALEAITQLDLALRIAQDDLPGPNNPYYMQDFNKYFTQTNNTVTNEELKDFLRWHHYKNTDLHEGTSIIIDRNTQKPDFIYPQVFTPNVPERQIRYSPEIAIVLARKSHISELLKTHPNLERTSTKKTAARKKEVPVCPIHQNTSTVNFMINSPKLKP